MGCQKAITAKITSSGGDYAIALKKNQPKLHDAVEELFSDLGAGTPKMVEACSFFETQERSRDRHEVRSYFATDQIDKIGDTEGWERLSSVAMAMRRVTRGDWVTTEIAYFVSSLPADAEQIAKAVRSHWRIENSLHWVLDVVFREDDSRVRAHNSAHALAVVRHVALNLIHQDATKDSLKGKRQRAAWDEDYLAKLVFKA
jgi:predicted transposase YbfD/YdcC